MPVYPVNHLEAHIMTSRFNIADSLRTKGDIPILDFPYLSILASSKQSEIVLTRGVGLHTIVGNTRDRALGEVFDRVAILVSKNLDDLR